MPFGSSNTEEYHLRIDRLLDLIAEYTALAEPLNVELAESDAAVETLRRMIRQTHRGRYDFSAEAIGERRELFRTLNLLLDNIDLRMMRSKRAWLYAEIGAAKREASRLQQIIGGVVRRAKRKRREAQAK